jgi:hypothetical protein
MPVWRAQSGEMSAVYLCQNCDEVVSRDFVRVFGTSRNEVHRCPACAFMTDIRNGDGVSFAPPGSGDPVGAPWPRR